MSVKTNKIYVLYSNPEFAQVSHKSGFLDKNSALCIALIFIVKKFLKPIFCLFIDLCIYLISLRKSCFSNSSRVKKSKIWPISPNYDWSSGSH